MENQFYFFMASALLPDFSTSSGSTPVEYGVLGMTLNQSSFESYSERRKMQKWQIVTIKDKVILLQILWAPFCHFPEPYVI